MSHRSRLILGIGDCICRQAVRLAGLRPSPAPALALREGVNVLLARMEEIWGPTEVSPTLACANGASFSFPGLSISTLSFTNWRAAT